jgi:predicted GNAT superfamily acetyltransferase
MTMSAPSHTSISDASATDGLILRRVSTAEEYDMCIRMQHDIWGETFTEVVPRTILRVTQRIGGVTAGAFDANGQLMGFVFGMTGTQDGSLVHWSDLLAVRPDARNKGIGQRLKLFQRELLVPLGVRRMYWTYDPLVAKNAYMNIVKLGARPVEYVVNMYGGNTKSALHGSLGTDRLIVAWELAQPGSPQRAKLSAPSDTSGVVGTANPIERNNPPHVTIAEHLPDTPAIRIEIPADVQALIEENFETAMEWRAATRRAFTHYVSRGYRVTGFSRDPSDNVCYYTLTLDAA